MRPFSVGDRVTAFGLVGKIVEVRPATKSHDCPVNPYPGTLAEVKVWWDNSVGVNGECFLADGKKNHWYKEPSLKHLDECCPSMDNPIIGHWPSCKRNYPVKPEGLRMAYPALITDTVTLQNSISSVLFENEFDAIRWEAKAGGYKVVRLLTDRGVEI